MVGCIVGGSPAYPLYSNPEHPRPPTEVALLIGPLATVDAVDLHDKGEAFALSPGCHSFRFLKEEGHFDNHGGTLIVLPPGEYALQMQAGHTYSVEPLTSQPSGPRGTFTLSAYDRDPRGNVVLARPCR